MVRGRSLKQGIHHGACHFYRVQHAPEQRALHRICMQADFVAIQFGDFEQFRNLDQRVLSPDAGLDGEDRGFERVGVIDGFGNGQGEGIKQAGCVWPR